MGRIALNQSRLTPPTAVVASEDAATAVLCAKIRAGDESAFRAFYEAWFGRAIATSRRMTGRDEAFCMDVVQDAMMKVVGKLPAFETASALEAWMMTAVRTSAIDRLRSEMRRVARERARGGVDEVGPARREVDELAAALRELGADERELLELRFARGQATSVIAEMFATTTNAVQGRVRRILAKLSGIGENGDA
jgi:RNA polymerase sigma-70 factor (ECF subfamily)